MAWPPILVRYGEIGIKSRYVRAQFERRLIQRIEDQLVRRAVEGEVTRNWGRLFVRASDTERALDALAHTFGIVSASPATETPPTMEGVADAVLGVARERLGQGASFAIRVRRSGTHGFTSLDVAKACAAKIGDELADRSPRVDLTTPDLELHAEVREGVAFVFTRIVKGPGGLPLGSQGRVGVLVDGPRAAHAAWLVGKRGTALDFYATDAENAKSWLKPLEPWVGDIRVRMLQAKTRADALDAVAPLLAAKKDEALVVADGALDALSRRSEDARAGVPVFRPLVGYAGERFAAFARAAELPEDV